MAGLHVDDIARTDLGLGPIVHLDAHATTDDVAQMVDLAAIRLRDGLHVLRPAPPRLEDALAHHALAQLDDGYLSVAREWPGLVRLVEVASVCLRHWSLPI